MDAESHTLANESVDLQADVQSNLEAQTSTLSSPSSPRGDEKCSKECCHERLRYLFCPIRLYKSVRNKNGDCKMQFEINPEPIRFIFNLYTLFIFGFSSVITILFADTDFTDNPVIDTFGVNSICVMMDDPPFSIFGSTVWWPATILLVTFEVFDYMRVYDHYLDEDDRYPITNGFLICYKIAMCFEVLSCIVFAQIFATSPTEHLYMHAWPYFVFLVAWCSLALKRYAYLQYVGELPTSGKIHVALTVIFTAVFLGMYIPNLYGAQLWVDHPWTVSFGTVNNLLMGITDLVTPMVLYGYYCPKCDSVTVILNRSNPEPDHKTDQ